MRGKQLFHGIEIKVWAIACFVNPQDCNDRALKNFAHQLMKISSETGMPIKSEPCFCRYAKRAEDVSQLINVRILFTWSFFPEIVRLLFSSLYLQPEILK